MVETGIEPELEAIDAMRPQEDAGKNAAGGKGGKKDAPPAKKDDKKGGKDPKLVG